MSEIVIRRFLIFGAILLLVLTSIQSAFGNNTDSNKVKTTNAGGTEHYTNCIIFIIGICNEVTGPLLWKFGFYCNIIKRDFTINAKGEDGERIHVLIRGEDDFKFLWGKEIINIELKGAKGILFWGGKSIIMETSPIIARLKVKVIYLTQ